MAKIYLFTVLLCYVLILASASPVLEATRTNSIEERGTPPAPPCGKTSMTYGPGNIGIWSNYKIYFAGNGLTLDPNNNASPKTDAKNPVRVWKFGADKAACDVLQSCVNWATSFIYGSFAMYELKNNKGFQCTAYKGENYDPKYFRIQNSTVLNSWGWNW